MDIVNATEICALNLEKENQIENTESLQQKISNLFWKTHFKIRNNLTFEQRITLKELLQSAENKVYSYDKGIGFAILSNKDTIQKIEEQIGESVTMAQHLHLQVKSKNTLQLFVSNKSLKLELISNFILPILFHHVCMES